MLTGGAEGALIRDGLLNPTAFRIQPGPAAHLTTNGRFNEDHAIFPFPVFSSLRWAGAAGQCRGRADR